MGRAERSATAQTVVEISTDKGRMEPPAPTAGTVEEILAQEETGGHRRPGAVAHVARARARRQG